MRHPTTLYYLDDEAGVLCGPARRLRLRLLFPQSLLIGQLVLAGLAGHGAGGLVEGGGDARGRDGDGMRQLNDERHSANSYMTAN